MGAQLVQQGQTLPQPVAGLALIDTGATSTCIDEDTAQRLGLPVIDVVSVASASHASTQQNVYPVTLHIAGLPIPINVPRAVGAPLDAQGLLLLIGRDVLRFCTLFYNGLTGEITLSI
jgi:predicted aspartyl protease